MTEARLGVAGRGGRSSDITDYYFSWVLEMWCFSPLKNLDPLMVKAFELNEDDRKKASDTSSAKDLEILTYIRPAIKFKGRPANVSILLLE